MYCYSKNSVSVQLEQIGKHVALNGDKSIKRYLPNVEEFGERNGKRLFTTAQLSKINNVYFIYKNSPKLSYHLVLY